MAHDAITILKKEIELRKKRNPNFSLRSFAKWLDISPAQLSQMLAGKRPITIKTLKKITERLDYSPIEKSDILFKLTNDEMSPSKKTKKMQMAEDEFHLISDWYHFAILSLTKIKGATADPRWIAQRLGIAVNEAAQAVLRLERLAIIETRPVFKQMSDPIEVLSATPSLAIRKYHKQVLNLALEKIETVPMQHRNYDSVTIPVNSKQLDFLKKQMSHLIEIILEQSQKDVEKKTCDQVYHLNVQLFPLTKIKE